jgi:hypothetical protein
MADCQRWYVSRSPAHDTARSHNGSATTLPATGSGGSTRVFGAWHARWALAPTWSPKLRHVFGTDGR